MRSTRLLQCVVVGPGPRPGDRSIIVTLRVLSTPVQSRVLIYPRSTTRASWNVQGERWPKTLFDCQYVAGRSASSSSRATCRCRPERHDHPLAKTGAGRPAPGQGQGLICHITDRSTTTCSLPSPASRSSPTWPSATTTSTWPRPRRRGVAVTNTPDVLTETTADFAWALLMAAARRLVEADRLRSSRAIARWQWEYLLLLGGDVHGKTLGIVGLRADRPGRGAPGPGLRHARALPRRRPRRSRARARARARRTRTCDAAARGRLRQPAHAAPARDPPPDRRASPPHA